MTRTLVPTLGFLALAVAPAFAATGASPVTWGGWANSVLTIADDSTKDDSATATKESQLGIGFSAKAALEAKWTVTDALKANIYAELTPSSNISLREAKFEYTVSKDVVWTMGKYIDHMGWIAGRQTGLKRVNASTIGYTAPYGNDVIGTAVGFSQEKMSGAIHIVNGYYSSADANNRSGVQAPSNARKNTDLGFGLDFTFMEKDKFTVNVEAAYDMHSAGNSGVFIRNLAVPAGGLGGNIYTVGLNAEVQAAAKAIVAAELMYSAKGEDKDSGNGSVSGTKQTRTQGMLLGNMGLETKTPMSVTVSLSAIQQKEDATAGDLKSTTYEAAVALLTNPLTSTNFGLNFEFAYKNTKYNSDAVTALGLAEDKMTGWTLAMEGIVTF